MARIRLHHLRSEVGQPFNLVFKRPISQKQIQAPADRLHTDFKNFSTQDQPEVMPGYWTPTHFVPENQPHKNAWFYGEGRNGATGHLGLLQGRAARLGYTPLKKKYDDMQLKLVVAPVKSAGQGFSIADLYLDVLIKYEVKNKSGYGLRLIRTIKYGRAVDAFLVKYEMGMVIPISEAVSTSVYRTLCSIEVKAQGGKLLAKVQTDAKGHQNSYGEEMLYEVMLEASFEASASGGIGIEYNGGASMVFKELGIEWKE